MFDDIIERGGVNLGFHSKPLLYALPRWGILKTRAVWSLLHRGKFRVYLVESNVPGANFETLRLPLDQASIGTFYDGASPGAELNPSRARKTKARKLHKLPLDKRATQTKSGRVMCTGCDRMLARSQARAKVPGNRRDLVQGHGLCKPCAAEQIAEFKRGFAARKKNPPAELSSAAALSESFNGKAPRKVTAVNIRWPRALMHVGPCAQLDYISKKWDGVLRQYFHEFKGRCDVFAAPNAMPDGDGLLIIKGKFKIKPEGITG